jgi:hypothetical protein
MVDVQENISILESEFIWNLMVVVVEGRGGVQLAWTQYTGCRVHPMTQNSIIQKYLHSLCSLQT